MPFHIIRWVGGWPGIGNGEGEKGKGGSERGKGGYYLILFSCGLVYLRRG